MDKKNFKVSYQVVKDIITAVFFFVVLWIIADSYFDLLIIFQPKLIGINTPLDIMGFNLVFFAMIWIIYLICKFIIDILYRTTKDSLWYDSLTEYTLRVPISKGQYIKIKDDKVFCYEAEFKDSKPYFSGNKFDLWVRKIIDDEIRRLND